MSNSTTLAMSSDVFLKIQARLRNFNPPILVKAHIVDDPIALKKLAADNIEPIAAQRTILGGIDFVVKNREDLLIALKIAKNGTEKAFVQGGTRSEDWKEHWALAISFLATNGVGFREPWRLFLNDRSLRISDARPRLRDNPEIDRFNLNIFSPDQGYSKVGVSFDLAKGTMYRWTISGSWGLAGHGGFEWSGTTSLSGRHDLFGGSR